MRLYHGRRGGETSYSEDLKDRTKEVMAAIEEKDIPGSDFLGWRRLPEEGLDGIEELLERSESFRKDIDVLLILGIGGSFLGAKAVYEALAPKFSPIEGCPEVLFLGCDLSSEILEETLDYLEGKSFGVNVISKSGKTLETAAAFAFVEELLRRRYPESWKERLVVTTDPEKGALRPFAKAEDLLTYPVAEDVGGRYSVLSPVGLFPLAVAGIDVKALLEGARDAKEDVKRQGVDSDAARYAMDRTIQRDAGKTIEILATYDPKAVGLGAWYAQLFGESEGKEGKGLFPTSLLFTRDLHSMGQWIQEGPRTIFETLLLFSEEPKTMIPKDSLGLGVEALRHRAMEEMNRAAIEGTMDAHEAGDVPNFVWELPKKDAYHLGAWLYAMEEACAISAVLLGVNPFNQPGVEEYKSRMLENLR